MSQSSSHKTTSSSVSLKILKSTGVFWYLIALAGHWYFAIYLLIFYGGGVLQNDLSVWNKLMSGGRIEGDAFGNMNIYIHITLAFVMSFFGPLQLIPQIRKYAIRFHRWNGRIYILTAYIISIGALYLVWGRGIDNPVGSVVNDIAISGNAILLVWFATMTIRYALKRDIDTHYRWAMRTFLVAGGVWLIRVGIGLWAFLTQGSMWGVNETLTGPFNYFLAFASYLLPLFFYELYWRASAHGTTFTQLIMSAVIAVCSILLGIGIFMAGIIFWLPLIAA